MCLTDYISLYGLKIWQEEFSRLINYNVEQECNSFLKQKIFDWQSHYQSEAIPIPTFQPVLSKVKGTSSYSASSSSLPTAVTFMGRLSRELLFQTSPSISIYVESMQGWYDVTGKEIVGIRTFSLLNRGVGNLHHMLSLSAHNVMSAYFLSVSVSVSVRVDAW